MDIKRGLIAACLVVSSSFSLPLVAESSAEKTGREMHEQILEEGAVYADKKVTDYVSVVGQKVAAISQQGKSAKKKQPFIFTVIDDPSINAFALPGGYIYIHRGLLTYLNSEAQLAAVLAHEVGHITKKHHGRQKRAAVGNALVSGILGILTRSGDVAEASGLWGQSLVSGFGREMELEADQVSAELLVNAGYDPQAMIDVIALLKDHERLEKKKALASGKKRQTYHGLFATHPRNDTRLQKAVGLAGSHSGSGQQNIVPFRKAMEGLVWGKNYAEVSAPDNVYQNDAFTYRLTTPFGWAFSGQDKVVIGQPATEEQKTQQQEGGDKKKSKGKDKGKGNNKKQKVIDGRLEVTVLRRTTEAPDVYVKKRMKIPLLKKSESIIVNRLKAHTGIIPAEPNTPEQRLAVIYYSRYAYVLRGDLAEGKAAKEQDKLYKKIIGSFRPVSRKTLAGRQSKVIHYVKATPTTTFERLAKYLKLGKYGEDELRIINGYYPVGEPAPGVWIKVVR